MKTPCLNPFDLLRRALTLLAAVFLFAAPLAQAAPTTPTADFTDNNDGTVTHKITGLTWKRCAEGQTWTGSTCSGTAKTYTWAQANALSTGGWRLPRIDELVSIVERDNDKPAINTTIFPNTPSSNFWSASSYAGNSDSAWWYVNFGDGYGTFYKTNYYDVVRLVRGGQSLDSSGLYTPTSDFSDNGDGSVTHKKTSLTWKRCAEGQTWSGSTCSGTAKRYDWSAANALSTGDWRLPTQNELQTLVEYSIADPGPTINSTIFPNTPASYFWSASASASAYAGSSALAWGIVFDAGYGNCDYKTDALQVRLVRGGQSLGASFSPVGGASTSADCLFTWLEKTYPQYFSPAGGKSQTYDVYTYRQYTGNTYLAISSKDNHAWAILAGNMMDAGPASQWYATAGCQ